MRHDPYETGSIKRLGTKLNKRIANLPPFPIGIEAMRGRLMSLAQTGFDLSKGNKEVEGRQVAPVLTRCAYQDRRNG